MANDINSVLPSMIIVRFPFVGNPAGAFNYYYSNVNITDSEVVTELGETLAGNGFMQVLHDSMTATYDSTDPSSPTNKAPLDSLAQQLAIDFWLWRVRNFDVVYNGVVAPAPSGYDSVIEWCYTADDATTRDIGMPMNGEPIEFGHSSDSSSCSSQSGVVYGVALNGIAAAISISEPSVGVATLYNGMAPPFTAVVSNGYPIAVPPGVTFTAGRWGCGWLVLAWNCPPS